ncbi:MAG: DUF817 domain-containing protein [Acidimicrobiales bacterium]|nr:DUF817 domain-containing protein [Hyphomonadaceae bacterium]RZV43692.1 MAG: DUF817 domain-containing protein [Acidimicrobiales bacterium]
MFDPRSYLHAKRTVWHNAFVQGPKTQFIFEFISFGVKQAWACLFGGLMLAVLLGTYLYYPENAALARYDFITIMAILIQGCLLVFKLETLEEARIILIFHLVGTVMEIFKTHVGSWVYPEPSVLRIAGVPLFSGFMYACVGSYLARVWRIFDFKFTRFPPLKWQALIAVLAYLNFFTHHYVLDIRNVLFVASAILYVPTIVWFKPDEKHRPMPLLIGLVLVALFIWFAENIGTFAKAWVYPGQANGWAMVSPAKLGAWYLLMLISFVLVAWVHEAEEYES